MKHDFDDAELIALQQTLAEMGNLRDDARAQQAVDRTIANLSKQPIRLHRRWIMRIGIAALLAITAAVIFQLTTPAPVAAAVLLKQATEKQEAVDHWITVHTFDLSGEGNGNAWSVQPKAGLYLYGDPAKPDEGFEMIDTTSKQRARYEPELKTLILTDFSGEDPRNTQIPLTLDALFKWPELSEYDSTKSESAGEQILTFTRRADAKDQKSPHRLIVRIDLATGLLKQGDLQMTPDAPLKTFFKFDQSSPVVFTKVEDLPTPKGASRLDLRTTPEVRGIVESLNKVLHDGIGLDGALIVSTFARSTDNVTATFGRVTLFIERDGVRFKGMWQVGDGKSRGNEKKPLFPKGWPTPTFDAALAAVKDFPCDQVTLVLNNRFAWTSDMRLDGAWPASARVNESPEGKSPLAESIYPSLEFPDSSGYRKYELTKSSRSDLPLLIVTDLARWTNHPNELRPMRVRKWMFGQPDGSPVGKPLMFDDAMLDEEGRDTMSHDRTDFDQTEPVLRPWIDHKIFVPTHWRFMGVKDEDGDRFVEYLRIIPAPGATVPQSWLKLPDTKARPQ